MNAVKKNWFVALCAAVFIVTLVIAGMYVSSQHDRIVAQETTMTELGKDVVKADENDNATRQKVSAKQNSADTERLARDTDTVNAMLNTALTWDSSATYTAARDTMGRKYKLGADSQFMKSFMPPAPVNKDASGKEYPYIDAAGLNSALSDSTVTLQWVQGTDYRYLVQAVVRADSSSGTASASHVAVFEVTVNGEGAITDIKAYASTSEVAHSGEN